MNKLFVLFFGKVVRFIEYKLYLLKQSYINYYYKDKFKSCGEGVRLLGYPITIASPENIEIGDNSYISEYSRIDAMGGLKIGDNTVLARGVIIFTSNRNYEGDMLPFDYTYNKKSVEIGNNVWIGENAMIMAGSKIGHGAIIGGGTVVHGVIEPLSIVVSSSMKVIKKRDLEQYNEIVSKKNFWKRLHD